MQNRLQKPHRKMAAMQNAVQYSVQSFVLKKSADAETGAK